MLNKNSHGRAASSALAHIAVRQTSITCNVRVDPVVLVPIAPSWKPVPDRRPIRPSSNHTYP
jgi:hypothetical protein